MSPHRPPKYDVAIVGGGVAGCYCAYQLSAACPGARIGLFETEHELGGRLQSVFMPGTTTPAELGGAFVSDRHARVCALARECSLSLTPVAWSRAFAYIRGQRLFDSTYRDAPDAIPYRLAAHERGRMPADILRDALDAIAPRLASLWPRNAAPEDGGSGADRYLQRHRYKERLLDDWPFALLLRDLISEDALLCLSAAFGSASNFGQASAYAAIRTILHECAPQRAFVFAQGFQALPAELARRSGADIHASTQLIAVRAESKDLRLTFRTARGGRTFAAEKLILALPPQALARIDFGTDTFAPLLSHLAPVPACKLFLTFAGKWWSAAPQRRGTIGISACYTDQPVQQCYRYDNASDSAAALVLALFADGEAASSWRPHFDAKGAPSPPMIAAALAQLRAMHGDAQIPDAVDAVAKAWPAAWHQWRAGSRSWRAPRALRGPHFGMPIFVCGEAYSAQQGWAEGAIESAESLLKENFLA